MRALWLIVIAASGPACLRQTEFRCATSADCGTGRCEQPQGYCSFADGACNGFRFGEAAGPYANQCVAGTGVDAGVDGSVDAAVDGPPAGCPGTYASLGGSAHRYRLVTAIGDWDTQRTSCTATSSSAYLTIPDDTAELQALSTLSGVSLFWVGISDLATENTFLTVKGSPAMFDGGSVLPWTLGGGEPDNGPPAENCVATVSATSRFNTERCNTKLAAICECDP